MSQTLHPPHNTIYAASSGWLPKTPRSGPPPPSWTLDFLSVPPTNIQPQAPSRLSPLITPTPDQDSRPSHPLHQKCQLSFLSVPQLLAPGCTKSECVCQGPPPLSYCPHSYHMHLCASVSGPTWHPIAKIPSQREMCALSSKDNQGQDSTKVHFGELVGLLGFLAENR